jgi:hypothetical protein
MNELVGELADYIMKYQTHRIDGIESELEKVKSELQSWKERYKQLKEEGSLLKMERTLAGRDDKLPRATGSSCQSHAGTSEEYDKSPRDHSLDQVSDTTNSCSHRQPGRGMPTVGSILCWQN